MTQIFRPWLMAALPFAGASLLIAISPARAQDQSGGVLLNLTLSQGLQANDNANLDSVSQGSTVDATTNLELDLTSQTRNSSIGVTSSAGLRARNAPNTSGVKIESDDVQLGLTYSRFSKSSTFDVNASYSSREIDFLDPLLLADVDGTLPIDFQDLRGTGTRRALNFGSKLTFGKDAPFGLILNADHTELSYRNVSSANLTDSKKTSLGATARFDLNAVMTGSLGLNYALFQEDGGADRTTVDLNAGLTINRPNGTIGFSVNPAKTEDGNRIGASVSRSFTLPGSTLSTQFGATQSASSNVFLTGGLSYTRALPRGQVTASLNRRVSSTSSDAETISTLASLGTSQSLTPRVSANLGMNYAQSKETLTGLTTDIASLRVGVDYALTEDWALNAGYRHEFRDEDGAGTSNSNIISLGLSRAFDFRY